MPYAFKVNRVTMQGTSFSGEEIWSTGFYLGNVSADADAPTEAMATSIGALWQTFFTHTNSRISSQFQTTEVKIAQLGTDGLTIPDSVKYYTYPAPISGVQGSTLFPPQIALVATLVGPQARGLASKGRMFLPGVSAAVSTNGRISDLNRGEMATNVRTFIRGVVDLAETNNVPLLASQGRPGIGGTAPVNHEIVSVRVGNVYDTQRRRRNGLAEAYSTVVV